MDGGGGRIDGGLERGHVIAGDVPEAFGHRSEGLVLVGLTTGCQRGQCSTVNDP